MEKKILKPLSIFDKVDWYYIKGKDIKDFEDRMQSKFTKKRIKK